jgi:hypothetical protein
MMRNGVFDIENLAPVRLEGATGSAGRPTAIR